ncbi:hypothetical protein CANARDRAFT_23579 [[Candida] arabinofermentans NRRL YB-2248]|uniref:Zn(2)-C6 fungal-type domain-containing protein n=1 Tax=[Candida] arabinofermentans NRRL YB-2248 TaxID=983967 RepID=A0A1E4SZS8_9ASCO|nr:hypothetical protein CANARDRAFT_23579 [[Candida] arabinofermentans NRRL YB-2248]
MKTEHSTSPNLASPRSGSSAPDQSYEGEKVGSPSDSSSHNRKKRARSARACLVCRERKVKCDITLRFPNKCSNCVQFNVANCILPEPKKRKSMKLKQFEQQQDKTSTMNTAEVGIEAKINTNIDPVPHPIQIQQQQQQVPLNLHQLNVSYADLQPESNTFSSAIPSFVYRDPKEEFPELYSIKLDPSKVLQPYMNASTVPEYMGLNGATPLMKQVLKEYFEDIRKNGSGKVESFKMEINDFKYLDSLGCFCLPTQELFWKYVNSYFEKVHPQMPIINKKEFIKGCTSLTEPKSLLLLHSVLFAGSRVCEEPNWSDSDRERQERVSKLLNKRAKALFDAQIEAEPIALLQSVIIFGNYWDSQLPDSRRGTYWNTKMAVSTAHLLGLHKNQDKPSELTPMGRKIYKRIWWTLFLKDCYNSYTFGRPWAIDLEDCDIGMLEEDDFIDTLDDGTDEPGISQLSKLEVDFFINRIKLSQTIRRILDNQATIKKLSAQKISFLPLLKESDMLMGMWLENLPENLQFRIDKGKSSSPNNFYSAILALEYYSVLLLAHRSNIIRKSIIPTGEASNGGKSSLDYYPSWSITYKSAHIVTLIGDYFLKNNFIFKYNCFLIYSMTSASVMMVYHLYNNDKKISQIADKAILTCMSVLSRTAKKWPVADFAYYNLRAIYNDKAKQISIIRGILNSANKEIINNSKDQCQTSIILDNSLKSYRTAKEFSFSTPNLSAERGTLNLSQSGVSDLNRYSEPPSETTVDQNKSTSSRLRGLTDLPVTSIFYKGALASGVISPSPSEEQRFVTNQLFAYNNVDNKNNINNNISVSTKVQNPNVMELTTSEYIAGSPFSDQMKENCHQKTSTLQQAQPLQSFGSISDRDQVPTDSIQATVTPSMSASSSSERSPNFGNDIIPDVVNDNWLPTFDTSSFPVPSMGSLETQNNVVDELFEMMSTEYGVYL